MDQLTNIPSITTKLTIASILLVTMVANSQPLSPYGQAALRDFPSASSSSSGASSSGEVSDSGRSLAELSGLTPQEAYILALTQLLENRRPAPSRRNSINKRDFSLGFAGLDNIDHILSTLNGETANNRYLDAIRERMTKAG